MITSSNLKGQSRSDSTGRSINPRFTHRELIHPAVVSGNCFSTSSRRHFNRVNFRLHSRHRTVELTRRRESKHPSPHEASCERRSRRSRPTICWVAAIERVTLDENQLRNDHRRTPRLCQSYFCKRRMFFEARSRLRSWARADPRELRQPFEQADSSPWQVADVR